MATMVLWWYPGRKCIPKTGSLLAAKFWKVASSGSQVVSGASCLWLMGPLALPCSIAAAAAAAGEEEKAGEGAAASPRGRHKGQRLLLR